MNEFEKIIEQLQDLDNDKKIKIIWIGVPIVMIAIIFIWLSFTDFSFKSEAINSNEEISKFEVLKNGLAVTLKDAGNLLKDFKEKINQTNTFELTAPIEKVSGISTTSLEVVNLNASTTINQNINIKD